MTAVDRVALRRMIMAQIPKARAYLAQDEQKEGATRRPEGKPPDDRTNPPA